MTAGDDALATPADPASAAASVNAAAASEKMPGPHKKVSAGFLILFGLLNFGLYLTVMMPALFSLPYKIQVLTPDTKALSLGIVATVTAVVGIVSGPLAGVLSDRTGGRFGRRKPWLIGGLALGLVGASVIALAPNLPFVILGSAVGSMAGGATAAAITPVVAERIPEQQRGTAGAIVGVATQLGGVLGYSLGGLLTGNLLLLFTLPLLVFAAFAILWVVLVPEERVIVTRTSFRETVVLLAFNPLKHPDFSWVWLGKLLMQIALAFLSTYQLYYLGDRLGFTPEEAGQKLAVVGGIGIFVTMTFAVLSGMLSDKIKRRKPFLLTSALLSAGGLAIMAFADGFGLFFAAVLCILGGAGMFGSVDVATASDLVPERDQAGRWMSIYNLAATLSTAIAPLAGSALLLAGSPAGTNYTALFLTGAVVALAMGAVTFKIRGVR